MHSVTFCADSPPGRADGVAVKPPDKIPRGGLMLDARYTRTRRPCLEPGILVATLPASCEGGQR
jgi:hypothetical protein